MSEDLLIDLCEPYLLDLIGFLAESMRRVGEKASVIAEDSGYDISDDILIRVEQLDYYQKAEILAIAANHVKAIAERDREAGGYSGNETNSEVL